MLSLDSLLFIASFILATVFSHYLRKYIEFGFVRACSIERTVKSAESRIQCKEYYTLLYYTTEKLKVNVQKECTAQRVNATLRSSSVGSA